MLSGTLLANRLYELFGPTDYRLVGMDVDRQLVARLSALGSAISECAATVVVRATSVEDITGFDFSSFTNLFSACTIAFYCTEGIGLQRHELDDLCFGYRLRKAPVTFKATPFDTLDKAEPWWAIYEKIGEFGDEPGFLTSSTSDSEATFGRYVFACDYVRPGDRIGVFGSVDGMDVISDLTAAGPVFHLVDITSATATGEFDLILDLEGILASDTLHAVSTLLAPAGRLLTVSMTNVGDDLILEERHGQTMQRIGRRLRSFGADQGPVSITVYRKPVESRSQPFQNRADFLVEQGLSVFDLGSHYRFPDIIFSIASKQFRSKDTATLRAECERVLGMVEAISPDAGAALCVLAYVDATRRFAIENDMITQYIQAVCDDPHVRRWQISLSFVRAESLAREGQRDEALRLLDVCLDFDAKKFHQTILTKQVSACLMAADILCAKRDYESSSEYLKKGCDIARQSVSASDTTLFGASEDPRFFFFGELAEVLTLGSRCAFAYEQYRRGGPKGLRRGLGTSSDLFRQQRLADRRDIELQSAMINDLFERRPGSVSEAALFAYVRSWPLLKVIKLCGNKLFRKLLR